MSSTSRRRLELERALIGVWPHLLTCYPGWQDRYTTVPQDEFVDAMLLAQVEPDMVPRMLKECLHSGDEFTPTVPKLIERAKVGSRFRGVDQPRLEEKPASREVAEKYLAQMRAIVGAYKTTTETTNSDDGNG